MCSATCRRDDHLHPPRLDVHDVDLERSGRPVGGEDAALVLDLELSQRLDRVLHRLPVGARAHDHGDLQAHRAVAFFLSVAWTARAVLRKSASVSSESAIPSRSWMVSRLAVPFFRQMTASRRTAALGSRAASSCNRGRNALTSPGWSRDSASSAIRAEPRAAGLSSSSPRRSSSRFWRKRNWAIARYACARTR